MRITNATLTVPKSDSRSWLERVGRELSVHLRAGRYPLRAAIARLTEKEAVIESTFVELDPRDPYRERFGDILAVQRAACLRYGYSSRATGISSSSCVRCSEAADSLLKFFLR